MVSTDEERVSPARTVSCKREIRERERGKKAGKKRGRERGSEKASVPAHVCVFKVDLSLSL